MSLISKETLRKIESSEDQKVLVVINRSGPRDKFSLSSRLEEEIARAQRYQHFLSLIVLALESSASEGKLLKEIIPFLKENLRQVDLISFYEKDNLILLLPETSKEGALSLSGRLKKEIESSNFSGETKAKVRLGMACYPTEASSGEELLKKAFLAQKEEEGLLRRKARQGQPSSILGEN